MTSYEAYLMQGMSQIVEFNSDSTDPDGLLLAAVNESKLTPNSSNDFDLDGDGDVLYVRNTSTKAIVAGAQFHEPGPVTELVPPAERPNAGHPDLTAMSPREFVPVQSVSVTQFDTSELIEHGINPTGKAVVQIDGLVIYGDPTALIEFAVALTHAATREQFRVSSETKQEA